MRFLRVYRALLRERDQFARDCLQLIAERDHALAIVQDLRVDVVALEMQIGIIGSLLPPDLRAVIDPMICLTLPVEWGGPGAAETAPDLAEPWMRGLDMSNRTCSMDGCDQPHKGHGLCHRHLSRLRRTGSTELPVVQSLEQKVLACRLVTEAGCWEWTRAKDPLGYGRVWDGERMALAHRVAYELFVGPIAEGLVLDHLCRNSSCVNPTHLEPVTQAENVRRGLGGEANRLKTHCPQGHEYTPENTYRSPGKPNRVCRVCLKASGVRWRRRNGIEPRYPLMAWCPSDLRELAPFDQDGDQS